MSEPPKKEQITLIPSSMPPEPERIHFIADRGDGRLRLDQSILRHLRDVTPRSRNRIQHWIDEGRVTVDGVAARRSSARLRENAVVEVTLPSDIRRRQPPMPESRELSIIYEDDALLVVNKPAGLVVHPSYKQAAGTLLNAILAHRPHRTIEPGIVTRLDKQTSGIVLIAVAPDVHRLVQRDAEAGLVTKEYLALVLGSPSPRRGTIDQALGRDPTDRRRVVAADEGTGATTRYEVVATDATRSLVRCELVTGRTHQIRLHLASRGWPIVGDAVYGTRDPALGERQALHAWRVRLPHPVTRQPLTLVAPPPADIVDAASDLFAIAGSQDPAYI